MSKNDKSLSDIHHSVDPNQKKKGWRRVTAFLGPAYLISVGYMDPGNWATDIAGGSGYGYTLIWVLLMSNLMALLLQSLSARLGIVQGRDLAQCNRYYYPKGLNFILYIFAEIGIAACDLAEVLGMAIGLNLLLGIPLLMGVGISVFDTFLLLYLQKLGIRKLEAFIMALVATIGICFWIEMLMVKPSFMEIAAGLNPKLPDKASLYIAIGIIGATVMPHNLYLHSALVQTRKTGSDKASIKKAIKYNIIDSAIALNLAFLVNAAILILAAGVFYKAGMNEVASLEDAHKLLAPMLGNQWASHLFAIALIVAGQSSTITGTLAGQIVMEGYLQLRINPIARRLITRLLAVIPAALVIWILGPGEVDAMLIFSQVILSMQLAFAIIPLIHFVSDRALMGDFTISTTVKIVSWLIAIIIISLNLWQVFESGKEWLAATSSFLLKATILILIVGFIFLLFLTTFYPLILKRKQHYKVQMHKKYWNPVVSETPQDFKKVALALDFGENDQDVIYYASLFKNDVTFVLIHVMESASARTYGAAANDQELQEDKGIMDQYIQFFKDNGNASYGKIGFGSRVAAITEICKEEAVDLIIVGSHGHRAFKDILFGETVNSLRHKLEIPLFIAKKRR
ncbi:MAG TPA: Nramp family divalent metal transporter [Edaphocola sp.]|nr:Nramp family divalent metal transporter [Edaphocola sp.]